MKPAKKSKRRRRGNLWLLYEGRKWILWARNLTPAEYEKSIKTITRQLGV